MEYKQVALKLIALTRLSRAACTKRLSGVDPYAVQWIPVIRYVAANDGCTQVELARHLNVTSASVALSTKRMAKAGYLRKHVDEYNLRKNRLHVTEAGLKLQADCREIFDRYDHELFAGFSEAELAQLFDYFDRIEKNIAEDGEPCNNKNKDGENSL